MAASPYILSLASPDCTAEAARNLSNRLNAGDTILLSGPVGAGKTHFARNLIQGLLLQHEDVPSPTFTLVQTYDTRLGALWHADLYRLSSSHEIEELGLADTFGRAICVVEWPDRLQYLEPLNALRVALSDADHDDARRLCAEWTNGDWSERLDGWWAA